MAIRIFAVLTVSLASISSFAAVPLVTAERASNEAICHADFERTAAEMELAQWKLTQLEALQCRGHASWQEVAEQLVTVRAATARASAAKRLLQFLSESLACSNDPSSTPVDTESIPLYLPGSARLVGWIPAERASHQLVTRQLEDLTATHKSLLNIDFSPYVISIEKTERSLEAYSRSPSDAHHLRRAKIQLRLAKAEYELVQARKVSAAIVARRIKLLRTSLAKLESSEPDLSIAQVGTTFVDCTSDRELAELVITMANEETTAIRHLEWLEQRRQAATSRIAKLEELSKYPAADARELEQARADTAAIDGLIRNAATQIQMYKHVAGAYTARSLPVAEDKRQENSAIATDWRGDAAIVRHMLQLQQIRLQTTTEAEIVEAHHSYLRERMTRLERIEPTPRLTNELDDLRQNIKTTELRSKILLGQSALLEREKQRFLCQVRSQFGENFQLVQAADGEFLDRDELSAGAAAIAVVGIVGDYSRVFPKSSAAHAYLESTTILGCVASLTMHSHSLAAGVGRLATREPTYASLRANRQSSLWKTPASGGLRSATDGITYPIDLFCYSPHELWKLYPGYSVSTRDYLRSVSSFRTRIPSYSSEYAFGIRRLDVSPARYRRRANSYGGPWYLPGSPTNFRD